MAEAGYKGETVVVLHPTDHPTAGAALLTAANLKKIGVNVELQALDWATLGSRRTNKGEPTKGGWSIFHTRWDGLLSSPLSLVPMSGACDKAWFGWPCDPEMEKLRAAFSRETDPAKQKELALAVSDRIMNQAQYVVLGQYLAFGAYRKDRVDGWLPSPAAVWWNISKK